MRSQAENRTEPKQTRRRRVVGLLALLAAVLLAASALVLFLPVTEGIEVYPGTTTAVGCGPAWSSGPDSVEVYSSVKVSPCQGSNRDRRYLAIALALFGGVSAGAAIICARHHGAEAAVVR